MRKWNEILALGAAVVLALTMAACDRKEADPVSSVAPVVSAAETKTTVFPEGTSIGGKNVSGKTAAEALSICRAAMEDTLNKLDITVKFKDDAVALTREDFTVKDMMDQTLPKLLSTGKAGKYELSYVVDLAESGEKKLADAAAACTVKGKEASVSGFDTKTGKFIFTEEQPGTRADLQSILKSVRQLLSQKKGGDVQATFLSTQPKITKKYLADHFKLMSSYTTESTNTWNGNSNMALALSHVNGTVLQPGQVFSYNDTIGDSTDPSSGWLPAGGLVGGLHVQVYGGGICQGSTTIYNAALMAGMEIVERECHSSPSTYCPIGLDATVDYGNIDFRFRNPLENPVYIASWMDDVTLHVNFYGVIPKEWDKIVLGSEQTGVTPYPTEIRFKVDDKLAKGEYMKVADGEDGYTARAWRTYYKGDKVVKTEELLNSVYEPTPKTYSIGPDTDQSKVDTTKESGTTKPSPSPTPTPTPEPETPSEPEGPEDPALSPGPTEEPPESDPGPGEDPFIGDPTPPPSDSSEVIAWG